jgi:hypothetical protein
MPIDVNDADRSRVLGMITAYLHGKVSIAHVRGTVSTSSFRGMELRTIFEEAEASASTVPEDERRKLMTVLKDELQMGFL